MNSPHRSAAGTLTPGVHRSVSQSPVISGLSSVALLALGVAVLALMAYVNALGNGFALDDYGAIVENPLIRSTTNIGKVFSSNYWATGAPGSTVDDPGLYRPLTVLSFLIDYQIWGLKPAAFHALNVALHAATSVALFVLAIEVLASPVAAFVAAGIFAVHPMHTEAVTGIVGRAEVLAAFFFVLAFWISRQAAPAHEGGFKRWLDAHRTTAVLLTTLLYFLGMLSKETAVSLPAVLFLDDWLRRKELERSKSREWGALLLKYGCVAAALAVYLALRSRAVGGHGEWPGFAGVSAGARALTASRVLLEYIGLFLFPRVLLAEYWKPSVPIASVSDPLALLSLVVWIALGFAIVRKWHREQAMILAVAWFFITILPVSNLLFPIGVGKAERILYLPSAGLSLAAGGLFARFAPRLQPAARFAIVGVAMLLLAGRTLARNADWRDNFTLATATLKVAPRSPLMNDMAGRELAARGDHSAAIVRYQAAIRETPGVALLHSHLGASYLALGMLDAAIAEYQTTIRLNPSIAEAHGNLGMAYLRNHQPNEALRELQIAQRADPTSAQAHIALGMVYSELGNLEAAETELNAALARDPNNSAAQISLGLAYLKRNRTNDAARLFAAATESSPTSPEAHNNLGFAYEKLGRKADAISEYQRALALRPGYERAKANLERALAP